MLYNIWHFVIIYITSYFLSIYNTCDYTLSPVHLQSICSGWWFKKVVRCKYIFIICNGSRWIVGTSWNRSDPCSFSFELYLPEFKCKVSIQFFLNIVFYPCTFPNYPILKQFKCISVFPYILSRFWAGADFVLSKGMIFST